MSKQYVQHISGQGEKWEVQEEVDATYCTAPQRVDGYTAYQSCYLPKSEYRLCPAPEVWMNVTEECAVEQGAIYHKGERMYWANGYRPRKVHICQTSGLDGKNCPVVAFIIEKKVSE